MSFQEIQNRIAIRNRRLKDLLKARGHVDAKIEEMGGRMSSAPYKSTNPIFLMWQKDFDRLVAEAESMTRKIYALHEEKNILIEEWKRMCEGENANA